MHHLYTIQTSAGSFEDPRNLLKANDRTLRPISGDGNCMFRALAMAMYGSESFHDRVRQLLATYIEKNSKYFKKYLTSGTMEAHLKRLKELGQWGTHMELKAAAVILKLPMYIYTPTLRADGEYAWNKIIPCSHQSEIPELNIDGNTNHIELCHTKGVHYDLIVLKNGTSYQNLCQINHTF